MCAWRDGVLATDAGRGGDRIGDGGGVLGMVTDLQTLEERIQDLLKDSGGEDWYATELDQAVRLALSELSQLCPSRGVTTIQAVDEQYEYSLSAVTGLQGVAEVWYPYLSTDDSYKRPHAVKWRMLDDATLLLEGDQVPDVAYKLRVFYDKVQTVGGLDAAAVTTLNDAEKSCVVIGAAGYAAVAKAQYLANRVTTGADAALIVSRWGNARLMEFKQRAFQLGQHDSVSEDARIGWWSADKWDV